MKTNQPLKYRVWNLRYKTWVNHIALVCPNGRLLSLHFEGNDRGTEQLTPKIGLLPEEENVVERFTGLLDRDGKEIYEGDIIKMGEPRYDGDRYIDNNIGVVSYINTVLALCPIERLEEPEPNGGIIYFPFTDIPPVIGNIHETPI